MSYRVQPPKEKRPIERIAVTPSRLWGVHTLFPFLALLVAGLTYGSVHLECVRPAAGQPAQCTGKASGLYGETLTPFTLGIGTVRASRTSPDGKGRTYPIIATRGGALRGMAVDDDLARRAAAEADRFREDPQQLAWRIDATESTKPLGALAVGLILFLVVMLGQRTTVVIIDPNERLIFVNGRSWGLHDGREVVVVPPTDGSKAMLLLVRGDDSVTIAEGSPKAIAAAAKAIRSAKRQQISA